jgi:putative NADH-flavin reductase
MRLAVFGANGPTGRLVVRQGLDAGHEVVAVTRHPEAFPLRHEALRVHAGDVADPHAVEKAIAGQDAVVSSLGVPFGFRTVTVYSVGVGNIIAAMRRWAVDRFVGVTSSAVDPGRAPTGGGLFFRAVLQPLVVHTMGATVYDDMRRMEALVTSSPVDWTIVRPSGLFERAGVGDYTVGQEAEGRFTARSDLADLLLREAGPTGRHHREVVFVSSRGQHPSILSLIWREGIRSKR